MAILECMWQRGLVFLAILLSACLSVVVFLPVGSGPYTAVYGPASALRAQRAILLLVLAISFVTAVVAPIASCVPTEFSFVHVGIPVLTLSPSAPLATTLRC